MIEKGPTREGRPFFMVLDRFAFSKQVSHQTVTPGHRLPERWPFPQTLQGKRLAENNDEGRDDADNGDDQASSRLGRPAFIHEK